MAVEGGVAIGKPRTRQVEGEDLEMLGKTWNDLAPTERVAEQSMY